VRLVLLGVFKFYLFCRFISPTTFPGVNTLEEYAEKHGHMMKEVSDLHFVNFDVLFASVTLPKDPTMVCNKKKENSRGAGKELRKIGSDESALVFVLRFSIFSLSVLVNFIG
jgi:hypothetical protein